MNRIKRVIQRRPSAAMIVAVVALIAGLTGTAVAGSKFLSTGKFQTFKKNTNSRIASTVKGPIAYSPVTVSIPPTPAGNPGTDISAPCPTGTVPTGGGIKVDNDVVELVNDSHPSTVGWSGTVKNTSPNVTHAATVTAICASSLSTGVRPNP